MADLAERLWMMNNEYQRHLSQAKKYVGLLGELILEWYGECDALDMLAYIHEHLEVMKQELRQWRYNHYYQPGGDKRMVQETSQINRALSQFDRLRHNHKPRLTTLYRTLDGYERPDPRATKVPNGDLWDMTLDGLETLIRFENVLRETKHNGVA